MVLVARLDLDSREIHDVVEAPVAPIRSGCACLNLAWWCLAKVAPQLQDDSWLLLTKCAEDSALTQEKQRPCLADARCLLWSNPTAARLDDASRGEAPAETFASRQRAVCVAPQVEGRVAR